MRRRIAVPELLLFVFPVVGASLGGASVAKLAIPAAAAGLALWLAARDPARYVQLLLWTLILVTGLRRYVDWHAGYSPTNPMMLAPYLEVVAATPAMALYLISGRRYTAEFVAMLGVLAAAFGYALMTGAMMDGTLALMRWLAPPWIALYVCARAGLLADLRGAVHRTFRLALPAAATYGIVQFVNILPWDA